MSFVDTPSIDASALTLLPPKPKPKPTNTPLSSATTTLPVRAIAAIELTNNLFIVILLVVIFACFKNIAERL